MGKDNHQVYIQTSSHHDDKPSYINNVDIMEVPVIDDYRYCAYYGRFLLLLGRLVFGGSLVYGYYRPVEEIADLFRILIIWDNIKLLTGLYYNIFITETRKKQG